MSDREIYTVSTSDGVATVTHVSIHRDEENSLSSRRRKTVVYQRDFAETSVSLFPCVEKLVTMYASMVQQKKKNDMKCNSSTGSNNNTSSSVGLVKTIMESNEDKCDDHDDARCEAAKNDKSAMTIEYDDDVNVITSRHNKIAMMTGNDNSCATTNKYYNCKPTSDGSKNVNKNCLKIDCERYDMNCSPMMSDEGCSTNISPYSSSSEDEGKCGNKSMRLNIDRDKVTRSASSDSAVGLDEENDAETMAQYKSTRRATLTVTDIPLRTALLPVAEPTSLPESPTSVTVSFDAPLSVPSKTLLEARVVEIAPIIPATDDNRAAEQINSRRESSQSHLSDTGEENRVRYVRTPSVVVSDYSDDVMCGITLEEIEFFRRQRLRRGSIQDVDRYESDMSTASSCSNLNYCGSTISAIDAMEMYQSSGLETPHRKSSACSTCSTYSGDEDDTFPVRLTEALNTQRKKKVGPI
ncbi:uncharacterized protein LOC119076075 [Bradysia coprophila]|uniref:uncharacterized protein LOC119076075 n=1 Tax=Bradysia coprophila TaxID=38358 RepID=UPI00187D8EAC|nr:uncharacterized protein LOC119076075 [Bradysia coprophila]